MFNKKKFKYAITDAGKTPMDVANKLGINESTFYRKLANDGSFNRSEIEIMVMFLNIKNPMEIFFSSLLAEMQENE